MNRIKNSISALFLLLIACSRPFIQQPPVVVDPLGDPLGDIKLWQDCSREEAHRVIKSKEDGAALLQAVSCYAVLVEQGSSGISQLEDAKRGRKLAEEVVHIYPTSGVAHYMLAYLTGLEAEHDPLRGLDLVPFLEVQAKQAAALNPKADNGGADRLLGELYLRAPEFPVSVGDTSKAVIHYRRAYTLAPEHPENHLGFVEALLSDGEQIVACKELKSFYARKSVNLENQVVWQKSLDLFHRVCKLIEQVESR